MIFMRIKCESFCWFRWVWLHRWFHIRNPIEIICWFIIIDLHKITQMEISVNSSVWFCLKNQIEYHRIILYKIYLCCFSNIHTNWNTSWVHLQITSMFRFDFLNSTCSALVCLSKLVVSSPGITCGSLIVFVMPGNFKDCFGILLWVLGSLLGILRGFFVLLNSLNLLMRLRTKAS